MAEPVSIDPDIAKDVAIVQDISAISSILKVVVQITGMGFAAVARVTEDKWIACQVLDEVGFGLLPGGELPIKTTLCDEIRDTRREIIIDHVSEDPLYAGHHTPEIYGLQSYISVPIMLAGTLVAGIGFGSGFLGALRTALGSAAPNERAGLMSALYILSYLAFSVPALIAGMIIPTLGLVATAHGYGLAIILISAMAFLIAMRPAKLTT